MTGRAPPGKTYYAEAGKAPVLIDFPDRPQLGWRYRGLEIRAIWTIERRFETSDGKRHTFDEWQAWGDAGQPE